MRPAPSAGRLFSPLDTELELLPGEYTPLLHERLVEVGNLVPSFGKGATLFQAFTGTRACEATVRRYTERAGEVLRELEATASAAVGEDGAPGAAGLVISVDGAMVHIRGEGWKEARTLAIAEVAAAPSAGEEAGCRQPSYFSRCVAAAEFQELATGEIRRRGVDRAARVAAGADGALWCQTFFDRHCPQAVRYLDFWHVASYVHAFSQVLWTEVAPAARWAERRLHELKHEGPERLLASLNVWATATNRPALRQQALATLQYLEPREALLQYPKLREAGWPIGTGMVESANKQVVEERLKGPGMHWGRNHVDGMLSLRGAACSQRWDAAWNEITAVLRKGRHRITAVHAKT